MFLFEFVAKFTQISNTVIVIRCYIRIKSSWSSIVCTYEKKFSWINSILRRIETEVPAVNPKLVPPKNT